jgi:hypothetical protein
MGRSYAYYIVAVRSAPTTLPSLATLVGVDLPEEFAAALSGREGRS